MDNPAQSERLENIMVLIEGEEDLTVRPWRGDRSAFLPDSACSQATESRNREADVILIKGEEDVKIRPGNLRKTGREDLLGIFREG